jgi:signal peptidase I
MRRFFARLAAVLVIGTTALCIGVLATGRADYVITNGVSMNPLYHAGDLVMVSKASSYEVGQIVAYRIPAKHGVILHRIIGGDASGFVMKGDNNQSIDALHPAAAQVVGRAVFHLPQGGLWLRRLTSPLVLVLVAFALTADSGRTRRRRNRARGSGRRLSSPTGPGRSGNTSGS